MRILIRLAIVAAVIVAGAALAVHFLVPPDLVRERVAAAVREQTGRDLSVMGDASLSLWPTLGVELSGVTLSDPPGMEGETLRMDSLKLDLALLPLLSRQIAVERFVLLRPVITLRRNAEGNVNWSVETPERAAAPKPPRLARAQTAGETDFRTLTLADVRIEDGTIHWIDELSGASYTAEAVDLSLSLPTLQDPLDADGSFKWRGETVTVDVEVGKPQALRAGQSSPLSLSVAAPSLKAEFDGSLTPGDEILFAGDLEASSPSVRQLLEWLGDGAPTREGFGAATLSGRVSGRADEYALKDAELSFDGMKGQGQAILAIGGDRPYLRAALALDRLILDPYLSGPPPERRTDAPRRRDSMVKTQADEDSLGDFIETLDEPAVEEPRSEPQPLAPPAQQLAGAKGLKALDADVNLNAGGIQVKSIRIGKSAVEAQLKNGVLDATLEEMALYGGAGEGAMRWDGRAAVPELRAKLELSDVSALPLLQDAAEFGWISGLADVSVAVEGRGRNGEEMTQSLDGQGSIRFTDGAIEGFNIPQMLRALKQGQTDWRSEERLKTDFSELSGTFTMQDGLAMTNDIMLMSPLLRVTAEGTVDLPRRWLDIQATPTVVASLEGQGGEAGMGGITVPFNIEGPWRDPRFRPDFKRLLRDPEATAATIDAVREQIKELDAGDVGRILDGLLGPRGAPPGESPDQVEPEAGMEGDPEAGAEGGWETEPPRREGRPRELLRELFR